jgi:hypothetical protein
VMLRTGRVQFSKVTQFYLYPTYSRSEHPWLQTCGERRLHYCHRNYCCTH